MIIGEVRELDRPYLRCRLSLPRLGVIADDITFLVDTGADTSYLHPGDGSALGVPFDLLQGCLRSQGIGGTASYFQEPAVLIFIDESTAQYHGYRININIAKPGDVSDRIPSLLGRNVIRRWQMDYDPTNGRLAFTVRDADFTMAVE